MKKKIFFGINALLLGTIIEKKIITIKKISDKNFEPLIKKDSYILIIKKDFKKEPNEKNFIYYFDEKLNKFKITYKIASENSWVSHKNLKTLLKVPKNHIGISCYEEDQGSTLVLNKAFVVGYPIFLFDGLRWCSGLDVDESRLTFEASDFSFGD